MDLVLETNQSSRLALAGSVVQVRPTRLWAKSLYEETPKGRWGAASMGDSALLPIIVVRFHRVTLTILGE